MANLKLNFDEYIPLRDIVFKTLREAIVTGELKSGERLMEIRLANEMGVSRTPVREAIRKLEQEGLVYLTARKGAVVAPINSKDLRDVMEIRRVLESLACKLACEHTTDEDILDLEETNDRIQEAIDNKEDELIARLDSKFHEMICEISGNKKLVSILGKIKELIFRYRLEYISDLKNKNIIIEEHKKIINDLKTKNEKAVRKDIEHHIEIQEKFILNSLEKEE